MESLFFNQIIGIDQTGALDSKNRFRPLYSVTLKIKSCGEIASYSAAYLPALNFNLWRSGESRTLVVVDAVLGLPEALLKTDENIRDLFKLSQTLTQFGMRAGEKFFSKLYQDRVGLELPKGSSPIEFRECDRSFEAQSVFRTKPYQRNVQTGTLRIWHELSNQTLDDVAIWPFDPVTQESNLVLAEGYPKLFQNISLPKSEAFRDPNFRDAAQLAFGARSLMLSDPHFLTKRNSREGAILSKV